MSRVARYAARRCLVGAWGALAVQLAACKSSGEAPPDGPRIQIVGETVKVRRGEPPPAGSAVFDGRTVRLRAARGETLGLQVLLHRTGERAVSLTLEGPGVAVEPFRVGFQRVVEPSSKMYGPSLGAGAYPDILTPAPPGPVRADDEVYFDVAVAAAAAPGRRRGKLLVGADRFPVELIIEPVAIELERGPLVWVWFKSAELARKHGLDDGDSPAQIAIERSYMDLFRSHGALLASDLPPARLRARAELMTDDVRYWPVWVDRHDPTQLAADVAAWLEFFRDRKQIPFTIGIDEPRDEDERELARREGMAIRAAGGGHPRLLYAVTDGALPLYRGAVDVFIFPGSIPPPPGYGPDVRFWTYNGQSPVAGNMTIDKPGTALRTWGWIAERYDVELWYVWEGLYFTDRYNRASRPTDLMSQPLTFDERRRGGEDFGNGDGVLVYPGPLPSLRLKALRRGLLDRLLLRRLAECGGAGGREQAARLTAGLVPAALGQAREAQSWPDDEVPWERARQGALDAILTRCGADGHGS
ncbi:MAG TPA: hypothetical protein VEL05_11630 [Candidatus Acidoferrum sp.]|nr:hypothetical protein [Candidatus Acidoferrum sp.]